MVSLCDWYRSLGRRVSTHECDGRDERADVVAFEGVVGDIPSSFYPFF